MLGYQPWPCMKHNLIVFFFLPLPSDMAWHCDGSLVTMCSDPIRVWQNIEKEHISSDKMVLARLGFES